MQVHYDSTGDLLYLRFDERTQQVINRCASEDIVLDIGDDDKIVGIEILDASRCLNLQHILPIRVMAAPLKVAA